jgi:multidrug efflux system membrane fusion protein
VSEEKVNELRTAEAAAAATLKADQAAVELASARSPTPPSALRSRASSARAWSSPVRQSRSMTRLLAVVNRIRPLYVTFSVPEKHLPRLRKAMAVAKCAPA